MGVNDRHAYKAARENKVYVVASYSVEKDGRKPKNAARLISPDGAVSAVFEKQHLFGKEKFTFARGRQMNPAKCSDFNVGAAICYDTMFTDVTRNLVRRGADIVLVPNADPDMPGSALNYLHSAFIPFRAAENGVPMVWADCGGLSRIVDGSGRILTHAPANRMTTVHASVPLRGSNTFFTFAGDWFAYTCTAAAIIILVLSTQKETAGQS